MPIRKFSKCLKHEETNINININVLLSDPTLIKNLPSFPRLLIIYTFVGPILLFGTDTHTHTYFALKSNTDIIKYESSVVFHKDPVSASFKHT